MLMLQQKNMSQEPLQNLIVWSGNRAKLLSRCQRQYYHQNIGSWLGWDSSSSPESQCAYRLKQLSTPELEIGNLLHQQIAIIFEKSRTGSPIHPSVEISIARAQFRDFVDHSRHRCLEELTAKRHKLLLHEQGKNLSADDMIEYEAGIATMLENFFQFPDVQRLLADPASVLFEHLDPTGFQIGRELGVPSRPKTDAVFIDDDNTVVVCDWKCGNPSSDHRVQGLVYALYISRKMNLPPTQPVEIRFYYLSSGKVEAYRYTAEEQEEMQWQISEDFGKFQRLSDDPIVNVGPETRFKPTVGKACFYCNFRLMCEPFLQSPLARSSEVTSA